MRFMGRALLQQGCSQLRLLPPNWRIKIDADAFLNSISYEKVPDNDPLGETSNASADTDRDRVCVGSWSRAPEVRSTSIAEGGTDCVLPSYRD